MERVMLTPMPVHMEERPGHLTGLLRCEAGGSNHPVIRTAAEQIGAAGDIQVRFVSAGQNSAYKECCEDPEGYVLEIGETGVTITASAPAGYLYGTITLKQLQRQFGQSLPGHSGQASVEAPGGTGQLRPDQCGVQGGLPSSLY